MSVAVGPLPSKLSAEEPNPTKSATLALGRQPVAQLRAVVFRTSATLPEDRLMLIVPVASGVGRLVVPPEPAASSTR